MQEKRAGLDTVEALLRAARELRDSTGRLRFGPPTAYVYNPLDYAWAGYEAYVRRYGNGPKPVVFLGMNPGPFGMVQTGVPFGDVHAVRDFLGIDVPIGRPPREHPKRRVYGFDCPRGEVSGRRLWGAIRAAFGSAGRFFSRAFIANYCPLTFLEASGRNRTPDKLPVAERSALFAACDEHLRRVVEVLQPAWVIGIGRFTEQRALEALADRPVRVGHVLHPSPASPAANRDWEGAVRRQLEALGVCALLCS